jgi:hypothetical protein
MYGYVAKVAAALLCTGLAAPMAMLHPQDGEKVAVIFPPHVSAEEVVPRIWNAGGYALSVHGFSAIAIGDDHEFFTRLRDLGAVLILDAQNLAALCGASLPPSGRG